MSEIYWRRVTSKKAVASSTPMKNIHLMLNDLSIPHFFDAIISGEQVARGKPYPEVFLKAARRTCLVPDRCLVFEDSAAGIAAAKRAGMKAIGITNTLPREKLKAADRVVQSLEEVDLQTIAHLLI